MLSLIKCQPLADFWIVPWKETELLLRNISICWLWSSASRWQTYFGPREKTELRQRQRQDEKKSNIVLNPYCAKCSYVDYDLVPTIDRNIFVLEKKPSFVSGSVVTRRTNKQLKWSITSSEKWKKKSWPPHGGHWPRKALLPSGYPAASFWRITGFSADSVDETGY